jgi:flavin reductase (DIM6/NTAB) family NADH-FMN oxidoreductase RutF
MAKFTEVEPFAPVAFLAGRDALLVSRGRSGPPNIMTIGWWQLGTLWSKPVLTVPVREERYTYGLLNERPEFTVNFPPDELRDVVMMCGTLSGRDTDKWKKGSLTPEAAKTVSVPVIAECAVRYECRTIHTAEASPVSNHRLYYGEILRVTALAGSFRSRS